MLLVGTAARAHHSSHIADLMQVHSLEVGIRRAHERELLEHYHASLLANGVDGAQYSFERCWHDYRFNMWRALLSLCAMAPGQLKEMKTKTGAFAPEERITDDDRKTKMIYEELNRRAVAAMLDHKWLDLLIEESDLSMGCCSGVSICY